MDSLSQIVLGAAVGEAVLGKKVGNKAALWGAVAGTVPDLDVIGGIFQSEFGAFISHRGFTHSVFFSVLVAPILGWAIYKLYKEKEGSRKGWSWLAFWALCTHPLLDCFTTWGTQLFYPISDFRVAFNTIFVVDPLYTFPFLICLLLALRLRRDRPWRRAWNYIGLSLSCFYLLLTVLNKLTVEQQFSHQLHRKGKSTLRYSSYPTPLNNILWYVIAEEPHGYNIGYYSLLAKPSDIGFTYFTKNHQLLAGHEQDYVIDRLEWASKGYYTLSMAEDSTLRFHDLRFGLWDWGPEDAPPQFAFTYELVEENGQFVDIRQIRGGQDSFSKESFLAFWRQVLGK